jgi:hypothetical protein
MCDIVLLLELSVTLLSYLYSTHSYRKVASNSLGYSQYFNTTFINKQGNDAKQLSLLPLYIAR